VSGVREKLVEFAKLKLAHLLPPGTNAYSLPWCFVHRGGELLGVVIDLDCGRVGVSVEEMRCDPLYRQAVNAARDQPVPQTRDLFA
jgi:hypothetical protein